ncbi:MAG: RNA ligase family protein [Leptospiraceae bacterium]|nr:RNA ligase family protein [Leptospiraceae bacterium]MBL0264920.1 RNA ligase family protein [Leptospiraceae bacterium]
MNFYKFPSTPHLLWLSESPSREDKVFDLNQRNLFLKKELIVEEKIDGANIGISFDKNANILIQNRGDYITRENCHIQFRTFWNWIDTVYDNIFNILTDKYILFGEWCYARHSIYYDRLPDYFLSFDIFEKDTEKFLSFERRNVFVNKMKLQSVPFIQKGLFDMDRILNMLNLKSHFSQEQLEGLYFRQEDNEYLIQRAKLVAKEFIQITEHWKNRAIELNRVAYSYKSQTANHFDFQ